MIKLLARLFIKNRDGSDPAVRRAYGVLCGIVGACLNVLLFALKYFAGLISGSIAITADAFNNLSDAGSSIITLVGFKVSGSRPDAGHPFGHGRYEYISGFIVAIIIILMGFELGKSSVEKILHPAPVESGTLVIVILAVSICVKLYMFYYNRRCGIKFASPSLKATALDSISDCAATLVVLIATLVSRFTTLNVDGWGGAAVALFILYTGICAARDTLSPLLGQAPSHELVKQIADIILAHSEIVGIHDLMVHDYGPGHMIISVHGEVSGSENIYVLHDAIDRIENELHEKLGCEAVIHMDPIDTDDRRVARLRAEISAIAEGISSELSIHDFRMVPGSSHTNLIFDVVLPPRFELSPEEVERRIRAAVSARWPNCNCVMKAEQSYI